MSTMVPNTIVKYYTDTVIPADSGFYLFIRNQFNVYQKVELLSESRHGQSSNYYVLDDSVPENLPPITGIGTENTYLIRSTLANNVTINDTDNPTVIGNTGSNATVTVNGGVISSTEGDATIGFKAGRTAFNIHEEADTSGNEIVVGSVLASGGNGNAITYSIVGTPLVAGFAINSTSGIITYKGTGAAFDANETITLTVTASDGTTTTPETDVTITVIENYVPFLDNNPQIVVDAGTSDITLTTSHLNYMAGGSSADDANITYTIKGLADGITVKKDGTTPLVLAVDSTFTQADVIAGDIVLTIDEAESLAGFSLSVSADGQSSNIHDFSILTRTDLTIDDVGGNNTFDYSDRPVLNYAINSGEGRDVITASAGDDVITAGRGDDKIALGDGNGTGGRDTIVYEYDSQNKAATDGADVITGFRRGEDIFTLSTKTYSETLKQVLEAANGSDLDSFADNQFIIMPDLHFTDDGVTVPGIIIIFRHSSVVSTGRLSGNSVQIIFDEAMTWEEFLAAIIHEGDKNFDYDHLAIKNAVVLPALLGGSYEDLMVDFLPNIVVTDAVASIDEGTIADTNVATLETVNVPKYTNFNYELDNEENFKIVGDKLVFKAGNYDAEAALTSYTVVIKSVTDDAEEETLHEVTLTVTITDINDEAPVITSGAAGSVSDEYTYVAGDDVVYTAQGIPDLEGGTITWSLKDNGTADNAGLFSIDGTSGEVTFKADTLPVATTYSFTIIADAGDGQTAEKVVTLTATDLNDAPTAITLTRAALLEGLNEVGTLGTVDADNDNSGVTETNSYEVTGGDDEALFEITGDQLSIKSGATRKATGETYEVEVTVTNTRGDEIKTYTQAFSITEGAIYIQTLLNGKEYYSGYQDAGAGATDKPEGLLAENIDGSLVAIVIGSLNIKGSGISSTRLTAEAENNNEFTLVGSTLSYVGNDSGSFESDTNYKTINISFSDNGTDRTEDYRIYLSDVNEAPLVLLDVDSSNAGGIPSSGVLTTDDNHADDTNDTTPNDADADSLPDLSETAGNNVVFITQEMIALSDPDDHDSDGNAVDSTKLKVKLISTQNGSIYVNGAEIDNDTIITYADWIAVGNVHFVRDDEAEQFGVTADGYKDPDDARPTSFTVEFIDEGGLSTGSRVFELDVTLINDVPVLVGDNNINIGELGETAILREVDLKFTDADSVRDGVFYRVESAASFGVLNLGGQTAPLTIGNTFTQQDVADGKISYTHNGGESGNDSFTYSVSDGTITIENQIFNIGVMNVAAVLSASSATATIDENDGAEAVNTGIVIDATPSDDLTATNFKITGGDDDFEIIAGTGDNVGKFVLFSKAGAINYDGADGKKSYSLSITATGSNGLDSDPITVDITVDNVIEATSSGTGTLTDFTEIQAGDSVYHATVDTVVVWDTTHIGGEDGALFQIDSTGHVSFKSTTMLNISDKSSYNFTVTAAAGDSTIEHDVTLTVEGVFRIAASSIALPDSVNIASSATIDTTSDLFLNPNGGGNTSDKMIALPALTDGEIGKVAGPTSYTYLARNSQGDSITFDFGDNTHTGGRFVLYNRINHDTGLINESTVAFILGDQTVQELTLKTNLPNNDGIPYSIEVELSDSSSKFDKVVLTFNETATKQNFSEIEIYSTLTQDFSFDENVTESDSAVDAANYFFESYNTDATLTEDSFTIGGEGNEKFDVVYNIEHEKFQLVAVAGANFDYEIKSSYVLTITANDGEVNSAPLEVTAVINNLNDAPAFDSEGLTGAITVGDAAIGGTLTIIDADSEESGYKTEFLTPPANKTGLYGNISFTAETNSWSYTAVQARAATIALAAGAKGEDTFTVTGGGGQADIVITVTGINDAPSSSDGEIFSDSQTQYTFSAEDFRFTDPDTSDSLQKVTIKSLPTADYGTLALNGTAVTLGQEILAADLGNLVFTTNQSILTADIVTTSFTYSVHDAALEIGTYTQTLVLKNIPEFTTITPTSNYGNTVLEVVTDLSEPRTFVGEDYVYRGSNDDEARVAYSFRSGQIFAFSEFSVTLNNPANGVSLVGSTVQFYYDDVALGDATIITESMAENDTITVSLPDGYDTAETILLTHSSGDYTDFSVANIKGISSVALLEGDAGNVTPISLGTVNRTEAAGFNASFSIESATSKKRDGTTDDLTSDFTIDATTGEISYIGAGIDQDIYSQAVKLVVAMGGTDTAAQIKQDVYVTILDEQEPASDWTAEIYDGIPVSKDHVLLDLGFEPGGRFFPHAHHANLRNSSNTNDNGLFISSGPVVQDYTNDTPEYPVLTFKDETTPDINMKEQYTAEILVSRSGYPDVTSNSQGTATINVVKFYDTPADTLANATPNDANTLAGDATARLIQGGNGNDAITGGTGGDLVIGGYGQDTITLGDGKDLVAHRFASAASATDWTMTDGGDTINNFDYGNDKLLLIDTRASDAIANYADFFVKADEAGSGTDPVVKFSVRLAAVDLSGGTTTYKITQVIITMANEGTSDGTNTGNAAGNALTIVFKTGTGYDLSASDLTDKFTSASDNTSLYDLNTNQYSFVQTILGGYGSVDIISSTDFDTEFSVDII